MTGLRTRVLVLAGILALAFTGVVGRLGWLQVIRAGDLAAMAERQYSRTVVLQAQRGPIVDRQGTALATSSPAESLFAQPRGVGDPVRVAHRLAPLIGVPERELHAALTGGKPFVWLRRRLPPSVAADVRALREPGLGFLPEPLRLYPNRELAAHVVGFEGVDGGLEGIERALNDTLVGTAGKAVVGRDALGREVVTEAILQKPAPGHGVMLTIDRTIQYLAEREIDAAYRRTQAKAAMAVVMEPRTGDVLAIAVRPTFNPNTFLDVPSRDYWRNRAVTDPFEPGSTFKVILAAAALEEGVVRPEDRIWAENGSITIAKTTIRDWKKYGWLSFGEVLQNSSNVGSIKVGLALGRERYYRYMTAFGFGALTGVGLAGESRGQLRDPQRWSALSLPTMSIGQEVSVTALQMVAAFGAVANGGTLMQPRLVRSIFDAEGRETRRFEPQAVRQVISPETARTLTRLMTQVVSQGTGHNAAIPGYDVAGKTGTAQKLDPNTRRYSRAPGVLSFVGFAPGRRAPAGDAGHARRAEEREVGQRGGGPDLLGDRRRGAALPGGTAARRRPGVDRDGAGRGHGRARAAGQHHRRARGRRAADAGPSRPDAARRAGRAGAAGDRGQGDGQGPGGGRPGAAPGRDTRRAGRCAADPGRRREMRCRGTRYP